MGVNKVVYGTTVIVDLTNDTVTADTLAKGVVAHDKAGNSITGTMESGSGATKNVQCYQGQATVSSTSYTATAVKLTVSKTGIYKVSWSGFRSTSGGTSGSQLYINNTAYDSAKTTFTNTYGQNVVLNNVSLTEGQEIVVRARARSTSYIMGVSNLCIVEQ